MTAPPVTVRPHQSVAEAARIMSERHVNRLPVVKHDALVGIVTRADLVRAFARPDGESQSELREDVLERTLWLDRGTVDVDVVRGNVQLTGRLPKRSDAVLLEGLAAKVPGVDRVDSRLTWDARRHDAPRAAGAGARAHVTPRRTRSTSMQCGAGSRPGTAATKSCTPRPASSSASTCSSHPSPTGSSHTRTTRSTSSSTAPACSPSRGRRSPSETGQAVFVPAGADHRFTAYEGLSVLVIFAKRSLVTALERLDAYWRAANYLSVGQIYLLDNPLLREPLRPEHVKPRLLGHFGTTPGLNLVYAHLNRAIRERELSALYIAGPGHGGPGPRRERVPGGDLQRGLSARRP